MGLVAGSSGVRTWCPVEVQRRIATRSWITKHLQWCGVTSAAEIGVRDGYGPATLAGAGIECTGFDTDAEKLKFAHTNFAGERLRWRHVDLPYTRAVQHSVDAVVLDEVVEEWENPRPLLREAERVLRPNGTLVVVTPNRLMGEGFHTRPLELNHAWEYTPAELRNLLGKRFRSVEVFGVHTGKVHRAISTISGECAEHLLTRIPPVDRAPWLRALTSLVRQSEFRVSNDPKGAVMLIGVGQTAGASAEIDSGTTSRMSTPSQFTPR